MKKKKPGLGCGCLTIAFVVLVILAGGVQLWTSSGNNTSNEIKNIEINFNGNDPINILLLGLDKQAEEDQSRSDSMIVLTIDFQSNQMSVTSIMRDIYLDIPEHGKQKINAAYSYGGPELTLKTINQNFGTELQYYATVDFQALAAIVDLVGGVDIEIKDYEVDEVNLYIGDMNRILKGKESPKLEKAGLQSLDGRQATAYCRIRHVGKADYERTERQRRVLSAMMQKMRDIRVGRLPQAVKDMIPLMETNMSMGKITRIGTKFLIKRPETLETYRIPAVHTFDEKMIDGMSVLDINWEKNMAILQDIMDGN